VHEIWQRTRTSTEILCDWYAHLDPDFRNLTFRDEGNKGKQLENLELAKDDILAFYAGLEPPNAGPGGLVYALIGFYKVECIT
jgi:hypothetical protein